MAGEYRVFVTGGTGYIGTRLIPLLAQRGHEVLAVCREQSRAKVPAGCSTVIGDALDGNSYRSAVAGAHTFVQLVGVSHPSPAKAAQFIDVDLRSGLEAVRVARDAGVQHFVYLSVAHPAPVMQAYTNVRAQCEEAIRASGMNSTIVRPWYVLGPGHRWPYALLPMYWIAERIPGTRESARRLGLVTIREMIHTLAAAIDQPASGVRLFETAEIRAWGRNSSA
ncbi:MAG: NAD(P)H-binding protein [Acidobacteriaceae bacterium]|nr:NAD(P)H-binding protein [Acidobacteriaceae bacterium]